MLTWEVRGYPALAELGAQELPLRPGWSSPLCPSGAGMPTYCIGVPYGWLKDYKKAPQKVLALAELGAPQAPLGFRVLGQ